MLFDSHLHTTFSSDSKMTLPEARQAAEQQGIGLIVTEHMDIGYPVPDSFVFDVEEYFAQYDAARAATLLLGIEVGMTQSDAAATQALIDAHSFDCVIGSIHLVDGQDIYQPSFYEDRSKQETYRRYFENMAACVELFRGVHTLGHIDYICRYARYDDTEIIYREMADWIDPVLKRVVERDMAMEINTRRLNDETAALLLPIYRRFAELGGRLATIGSDAHRPTEIGRGLREALAVADAAGLQPVYFKKGQPIQMR